MINRYFGVAIHPVVDPASTTQSLALPLFSRVDRVVLNRFVTGGTPVLQPLMALRLGTDDFQIPAGAAQDISLAVYSGPLSRPLLKADPVTNTLDLEAMVVFNMYTTFNWWCVCTWGPFTLLVESIANLLFWLMTTVHNYLTFDWSLSIILLVVIVRTTLHPVTKWSQIRMQRFGKQMQGMGPKQKLIQEKYKTTASASSRKWASSGRKRASAPSACSAACR
jgi:membrane protein insertase Oxa1/YidC/SpoIIIJ